jgi:hypothetical protein
MRTSTKQRPSKTKLPVKYTSFEENGHHERRSTETTSWRFRALQTGNYNFIQMDFIIFYYILFMLWFSLRASAKPFKIP